MKVSKILWTNHSPPLYLTDRPRYCVSFDFETMMYVDLCALLNVEPASSSGMKTDVGAEDVGVGVAAASLFAEEALLFCHLDGVKKGPKPSPHCVHTFEGKCRGRDRRGVHLTQRARVWCFKRWVMVELKKSSYCILKG